MIMSRRIIKVKMRLCWRIIVHNCRPIFNMKMSKLLKKMNNQNRNWVERILNFHKLMKVVLIVKKFKK